MMARRRKARRLVNSEWCGFVLRVTAITPADHSCGY
jgi:hypothetical protein